MEKLKLQYLQGPIRVLDLSADGEEWGARWAANQDQDNWEKREKRVQDQKPTGRMGSENQLESWFVGWKACHWMCQSAQRSGANEPWNRPRESFNWSGLQLGAVQKQVHHGHCLHYRSLFWRCHVTCLVRIHHRLPSNICLFFKSQFISFLTESHCPWWLDVPSGFDAPRTSKTTNNVPKCWWLAVEWEPWRDEEDSAAQRRKSRFDFEWSGASVLFWFPIHLPVVAR